jgi:hypothetical protein
MVKPAHADRWDHLGLVGVALEAADPGSAVRRHLRAEAGGVRVGRRQFKWTRGSRVFVIALGKAAPGMARAAAEILGDRIEAGLVTTLSPMEPTLPNRMRVFQTGHPLPDAGSLLAGQAALDLARGARAGDLVLALISGGGSAMAECSAGSNLRTCAGSGILLHAGAHHRHQSRTQRALLLKAGDWRTPRRRREWSGSCSPMSSAMIRRRSPPVRPSHSPPTRPPGNERSRESGVGTSRHQLYARHSATTLRRLPTCRVPTMWSSPAIETCWTPRRPRRFPLASGSGR